METEQDVPEPLRPAITDLLGECVQITLLAIERRDGGDRGNIIPLRDLSERLADRAQELQAVLDTAPIGIAVSFDERCRRVAVNAAGASINATYAA